MIFAIYKGSITGTHRFTQGKIYLARPGFVDAGAVDIDHIRLEDEEGNLVTIKTAENLFDLPDEVLAVTLKPVSILERGDVVTVIDADDGFLELRVHGFFRDNLFELLDRTNVMPGEFVLDKLSRRWMQIAQVDDKLNIAGEDAVMRSLTEFRFAVGNDGVLAEPLFKCVNAEGISGELTEGKLYQIASVSPDNDLVFVTNDSGKIESYMASRFSSDF